MLTLDSHDSVIFVSGSAGPKWDVDPLGFPREIVPTVKSVGPSTRDIDRIFPFDEDMIFRLIGFNRAQGKVFGDEIANSLGVIGAEKIELDTKLWSAAHNIFTAKGHAWGTAKVFNFSSGNRNKTVFVWKLARCR